MILRLGLLATVLLSTACKDNFHFTLVNDGVDNVHLFVAEHETQDEENKVEVGGARNTTIVVPGKDEGPWAFQINAMRNTTMMASVECPVTAEPMSYTATYTEDGTPIITCVED